MNTSAVFSRGHTLHAMDTTFVFQLAIHALAFNQGDDFLVTANSRGIRGHDFHSPSLGFRIARVHAKHVCCEKRGFIATRARPDFEDDVAFIVRIFGQEQYFQIGLALDEALLEVGEFLFGHRFQLRVRLFANHAARLFNSALEILVFVKLRNDFTQLAMGLRSLLVLLAVRDSFRIGQQLVQFFVASLDVS